METFSWRRFLKIAGGIFITAVGIATVGNSAGTFGYLVAGFFAIGIGVALFAMD